jgi:hypothetical protein
MKYLCVYLKTYYNSNCIAHAYSWEADSCLFTHLLLIENIRFCVEKSSSVNINLNQINPPWTFINYFFI